VGLLLAGIQLGWFLLLIDVVMPRLAGTPYRHWTYQALGSGPRGAIIHVVTQPLASLRLLFTPAQKLRLWIGLLGSWLFLPLLSPLFLVAIPSLLARFWSAEATLWSFHFHYSLVEAPILAFAAIDSASRLARLLPARPRLRAFASAAPAIAILAASAVLTFAVVKPLAEVTTYVSDARAAEIQSCLDVIPPDASVSASNFLLPHLDHRAVIYLLTADIDATYLAIDVSTYHHFAPGEEAQLRTTVLDALRGQYGVTCARGETVVLSRTATSKSLTPELIRWLAGACSDGGCATGSAVGRGRVGGLVDAQVASTGKPD
jgi:hypothetical protein